MKSGNPFTSVLSLAFLLLLQASVAMAAADAPETVLVRRGDVVITRADWNAEILRIPAKDRADFASSTPRNISLLERMLTTRELAQQARKNKLDADTTTRLRVRQEEERILAAAYLANAEDLAAREFEQKRSSWERRARELYQVDAARFATPETVMVTLLFFSAGKDGFDAAEKRAESALTSIKNGADIGDLAAALSDDTTTRDARGRKGPLSRADMDIQLASAVFALKNKGDLTAAVRTREGWFVVRLDERRAPVAKSFDEAKGAIMAELKQAEMTNARHAAIATVGGGIEVEVNAPAIDALRTEPTRKP